MHEQLSALAWDFLGRFIPGNLQVILTRMRGASTWIAYTITSKWEIPDAFTESKGFAAVAHNSIITTLLLY